MEKEQKLIYDLIFSSKEDYVIMITDYIKDIYTYDRFTRRIKNIIKKSDIKIIHESIEVEMDSVKWTLKLKK